MAEAIIPLPLSLPARFVEVLFLGAEDFALEAVVFEVAAVVDFAFEVDFDFPAVLDDAADLVDFLGAAFLVFEADEDREAGELFVPELFVVFAVADFEDRDFAPDDRDAFGFEPEDVFAVAMNSSSNLLNI